MACRKLDITDYFRLTPSTGNLKTHIPDSSDTSEKSPRGFKPVVSVSILNYRYYSVELGRWLSRDPIGEDGGYNLYAMVGNDSVDWWDYLGYGRYYGDGDFSITIEGVDWDEKREWQRKAGETCASDIMQWEHPISRTVYTEELNERRGEWGGSYRQSYPMWMDIVNFPLIVIQAKIIPGMPGPGFVFVPANRYADLIADERTTIVTVFEDLECKCVCALHRSYRKCRLEWVNRGDKRDIKTKTETIIKKEKHFSKYLWIMVEG